MTLCNKSYCDKFTDCQHEADEVFSCPICLEGLTSSGIHRPACLKCGHIFGEHCIQKWIKVIFMSNLYKIYLPDFYQFGLFIYF